MIVQQALGEHSRAMLTLFFLTSRVEEEAGGKCKMQNGGEGDWVTPHGVWAAKTRR